MVSQRRISMGRPRHQAVFACTNCPQCLHLVAVKSFQLLHSTHRFKLGWADSAHRLAGKPNNAIKLMNTSHNAKGMSPNKINKRITQISLPLIRLIVIFQPPISPFPSQFPSHFTVQRIIGMLKMITTTASKILNKLLTGHWQRIIQREWALTRQQTCR